MAAARRRVAVATVLFVSASWLTIPTAAVLPGVPVLTLEPTPVTVLAGTSVTLHCAAAGDPEPVISWRRREQPSGADEGAPLETELVGPRFRQLQNGSLRIDAVTLGDESFYSCYATNARGSAVKTVAVIVTETLNMALALTSTPGNTTVTEDGVVRWQCAANLNNARITWSRVDGSPLPGARAFQVLPGTLELNPALREDAGAYKCVATTPGGTQRAAHTVHLTVRAPPRVVQHPGSRLEVSERADLVMDCIVQGNPEPTVWWELPGGETLDVTSQAGRRVTTSVGDAVVFENGTLLVRDVTETSAGKFTCAAQNALSNVRAHTFVYVMYAPRLVWRPTNMATPAGAEVTLECEAVAFPQHRVTWFRDGSSVPISEGGDFRFDREGALVIARARRRHQGEYTCVAQNAVGSVRASAFIRIVAPPAVRVSVSSDVVSVGDSVWLHCSVSGDPAPIPRWVRANDEPLLLESNMVLHANLTLAIARLQPGQLGTYICTATSTAGTARDSLTLRTTDAPVLVDRPSDTTVVVGGGVSLPCRGRASATPHTTWYRLTGQGQREPLPGSTSGVEVTAQGALRIRSAARSHEGAYECVVSNAIGVATVTVQIDVQFAPFVLERRREVSVAAGAPLELRCENEADPRAAVTWFEPRGLQPISEQDAGRRGYQMAGSRLTVPAAELSVTRHDGAWRCEVCNVHGCDSGIRDVRVQGRPQIVGVAADWLSGREVVRISTSVIGFPKPDVTYFRGQQLIDPNNPPEGHRVLTDDVLEIDSGFTAPSYTIDVRNYHGSDSAVLTVPGGVSNVRVSDVTNTSVSVTWDAASAPGAATPGRTLPLRRYTVQVAPVAPAGGGAAASATREVRSRDPPVVVSGLTPHTKYGVTVWGENVLGASPRSAPVSITTPVGVPGPPRDLRATWNGNVLVLRWQPPLHLHGDPADMVYEVTYRAFTPDVATVTLLHLGTPLVKYVYGLSDAFGIVVSMVTRNDAAALRSAPSVINVPPRNAESLPIPSNVNASHVNSTAIRVTWELPESPPGSSAFDNVLIRVFETANPGAGPVVDAMLDVRAAGLEHVIGGLDPARGYSVQMATVDARGFGQFSEPVSLPAYNTRNGAGPPMNTVAPGSDDDDGDSFPVGVIVGIVAAILALLFILLVVCVLCVQWRRSRRQEHKERIIDDIYADNRSLEYGSNGYGGVTSELDRHYVKTRQPKVYTVSGELDPPLVYTTAAPIPDTRVEEEGDVVTSGPGGGTLQNGDVMTSEPRVGTLRNGSEFGYYKVRVSPPRFEEMYRMPAEAYSNSLEYLDLPVGLVSEVAAPGFTPRSARPTHSRVNKRRKKGGAAGATPSPVLRSAMRATPSPKSYRSAADQSPSNASRVRFEDQPDGGAAVVPETRLRTTQGEHVTHFRPISGQVSSPVHLRGPVVVASVVRPEPMHYTGLSERLVGRSSAGGGDDSVDEGYGGESGAESGFILASRRVPAGTGPGPPGSGAGPPGGGSRASPTGSATARAQGGGPAPARGNLFSKTVPWEQF